MKRTLFFLSIIALLFVVAACGTNNGSGASNDQTNADTEEAAKEIEVTHELGTTTVPVNPERVVVFDYGSLETLDELGVKVTGVPQSNLPPHLKKYSDDAYKNAGSVKEPDFEALSVMEPDLIIISGRQSSVYEELSELAPTIYMGIDTADYLASFKSNVKKLGEIFEAEKKATEKLDEVMTTVNEVKSITEASEGKGLVILTNDGGISSYGPGSRFGFVHDELGVTPADEKIEASTHGQNVSFEYIAETNPDYLFVIDRNMIVGGEASAEKTLANDLVQGTNAANNENIIYLDPYYWYISGGGLVSVAEMANEVKEGVQE
ncbi:siderophore ABC transporter substrate-binding protein [Paraliobacillus sp. JSM ZJ581]|uniref:siderophore ABC transporter substrate-binding protein n=1 Tax=Paraliobacillus sp. JSM ZJ581 TaxID=3342118 RepID=UPI0035A88690